MRLEEEGKWRGILHPVGETVGKFDLPRKWRTINSPPSPPRLEQLEGHRADLRERFLEFSRQDMNCLYLYHKILQAVINNQQESSFPRRSKSCDIESYGIPFWSKTIADKCNPYLTKTKGRAQRSNIKCPKPTQIWVKEFSTLSERGRDGLYQATERCMQQKRDSEQWPAPAPEKRERNVLCIPKLRIRHYYQHIIY